MRRLVVSMLFFLSAALSLAAALQHKNYLFLEPRLKIFVDLAIREGNRQLNHGHLNYEGINLQVNQEAEFGYERVRLDVRLRATRCIKDPRKTHRPKCPFKKLQVRCVVCGDPDFPFVDCVRRTEEQTRIARWDTKCNSPLTPLPSSGSYVSLILGDAVGPRPIHPDDDALPTIRVSPLSEGQEQVLLGSSFTISCSTSLWGRESAIGSDDDTVRILTGFYLTFDSGSTTTDRHIQSFFDHKDRKPNPASFLFPAADYAHQGNYTCVYGSTVNGRLSGRERQSKPLSLSVYSTPAISVSSINGVSQGQQQGQQQVSEGSIFTISCYSREEHPIGGFHLLTFGSGADAKRSIKLRSVNGRAEFPFPAADRANQGVYECVHGVTIGGNFYSRRSKPLSLAVMAASVDSFTDDYDYDQKNNNLFRDT